MPSPVPRTIPAGRQAELAAHPDATRLAIKPAGGALNFDYQVKRYPSRAALEAF